MAFIAFIEFSQKMSGKSDSRSPPFENRLSAQRLRLSPISDAIRKQLFRNIFSRSSADDRGMERILNAFNQPIASRLTGRKHLA